MDGGEAQFSGILSSTLDVLGYSYFAIRRRIDAYTSLADKLQELNPAKFYIVGSKGEGISLPLESDIDIVQVFPILCSDKLNGCDAKISFQLDQKHQPHGYTKLRLVFSPLEIDGLSEHIVYIDGNAYLSNDMVFKITKECNKNLEKVSALSVIVEPRSGPASPFTTSYGTIDCKCDNVIAFRCICTHYLDSWCSRKRCQGFPARDLIQRVTTLDAHVVPVGLKLSDENDLQWRICFTLAELCIIQSFNEVQFKVFILLKKLVKCSIQPVCPDITSYVVKNIILWVFENTSRYLFVEPNLTRLLIRSVHFLRNCVKVGYIPNYMIPQRNLILGKLSPGMRSELRKRLNCMMAQAGGMVFKCNVIRREMTVLLRDPSLSNRRRELLQTIENIEQAKMKHFDMEICSALLNGGYLEFRRHLVDRNLTLDPEEINTTFRLSQYFSKDKEYMDTTMSLFQTENMSAAFLKFMRTINIKEYIKGIMSKQNGPLWYAFGRSMRQIIPQIMPLIQCCIDKTPDFSNSESVFPEVVVGYLVNNTDFTTGMLKIITENPQAVSELFGAAGNNLPLPQVSNQALQELQKTTLSSISPEQFQRLSQNETVVNFYKALLSGQ